MVVWHPAFVRCRADFGRHRIETSIVCWILVQRPVRLGNGRDLACSNGRPVSIDPGLGNGVGSEVDETKWRELRGPF